MLKFTSGRGKMEILFPICTTKCLVRFGVINVMLKLFTKTMKSYLTNAITVMTFMKGRTP